jgi:hypothetical protein
MGGWGLHTGGTKYTLQKCEKIFDFFCIFKRTTTKACAKPSKRGEYAKPYFLVHWPLDFRIYTGGPLAVYLQKSLSSIIFFRCILLHSFFLFFLESASASFDPHIPHIEKKFL